MINDNRSYTSPDSYSETRMEYDLIIDVIQDNSSVLDLGCGNGDLLFRLKSKKAVKELGIEISPIGVKSCQDKNINVIQGSIDQTLPLPDNSFDYAICNVTMQMVMYPEILLSEMKRVAKYLIISFPNFGFYKNRLYLLTKGEMPKQLLFGYEWYNTGHIHQFSVMDFKKLIKNVGGLQIVKILHARYKSAYINYLMAMFPNLFQFIPIVVLKKVND